MIPPIVYMYFHARLASYFKDRPASYTDGWTVVSQSRIPKNIFYLMMKEMEKMGLLEKKDRFSFALSKIDKTCSKIEKVNELQHYCGLF